MLALGVAGFTTQNTISPFDHGALIITAPAAIQSDPLMESMNKMMKQMHAQQMKGNVDYDFASMLKAHHQGAIDMARIELQQGKDASMKKMAQKILTKQTKEVAQLNQLIAKLQNSTKNYDPANKQSGAGKAMSDNMMEMMKPGNMSMSSIDHEFADMMTKHHKDGIMMAKSIVTYSKSAKLKSMAQQSIPEQTQEIREMEQWMKAHQ
ncbi:hypothetical protein GCM10023313_24440 [Mucilaginibacter defluvii]